MSAPWLSGAMGFAPCAEGYRSPGHAWHVRWIASHAAFVVEIYRPGE